MVLASLAASRAKTRRRGVLLAGVRVPSTRTPASSRSDAHPAKVRTRPAHEPMQEKFVGVAVFPLGRLAWKPNSTRWPGPTVPL